jgi:hypothetical protein
MPASIQSQVGQILAADSTNPALRGGRLGDVIASYLQGRYAEQSIRTRTYVCFESPMAAGLYTAVAQTGMCIWNPPGSGVNVSIQSVIIAETSQNATTAFAVGLTGAGGQFSSPTSTSAVTTQTSANVAGPARGSAFTYGAGTFVNGGSFFAPLYFCHIPASEAVDTFGLLFADVAGSLIIPPACWASVAGNAAIAGTHNGAIVYSEIPT